MDNKAIGVFVCECGGKISNALNVPVLVGQVSNLSRVAHAEQANYWCLPANLERMRATIAEQQLDRIVIAGCAPRTHDPLFRRALDGMVNPSFVNVVNVRDLCAIPHRNDSTGATAKAHDQIAMAIADNAARVPPPPRVARITPHVIVIGGGIAGTTTALAISEANIPVTLVECKTELNGASERIATIYARANIRVMTGTTVDQVSGTVGQYRVELSNRESIQAGAIVVAIGAKLSLRGAPSSLAMTPNPLPPNSAFVLCDIARDDAKICKHTCCVAAIRQATEIKRQSPDANATIFFRELYSVGGAYDDAIWQAQQAGVKFIRYPAGQIPQSIEGEIVTRDELTGNPVHFACDQLIIAEPMKPQLDASRLAEMLRLPIDANGFIADARLCLRPSERIERGIYVCGAAHFPCDETRAIFQAYDVAARAARHIQRGEIVNGAPFAIVDALRCNGCGDCARACPFSAISLALRDGIGKLAMIDALLCTGCGNCVSVCPVKAASISSVTDEAIEAQIRAAIDPRSVLIFACEWSGYSAAEIAGTQQRDYPANTRIIRVNCTGRLQPGLLLKALELGAAGVMVLGCAPGACHYEQGNEHAAKVFEQANTLGNLLGFDERLRLEWMPADDGEAFVRTVKEFCNGL